MNRAAVFAHWDSENKIEDYVIFYLKELKKVTDCLVFVSDCSLEENERNKINKYADKIIAKPHGEYDFGSYKRGYEYLVENELLDSFDELIFANDSCFGPFFAFSELFNTMNKKKNGLVGGFRKLR